jgi:acyl-CoA synthetase (AMP-forming)/AMP-acid ligase II
MAILREASARDDATALDEAWSRPETFAFLPRKSAVDDAWVEEALAALPASMGSGHFALLTSGSTGRPKLVVGERERAERLARVLHEVQDGEATSETILTLPLSYCYAFVNQWLWARCLDRRLVATGGFGAPDALHRALGSARDAMLCLVGAQVPLLERHLPDAVYPGVTRIHFAGGPFPQHALGELAARFPDAQVFNNYGCAEAMPRLTIRRAADGDSAADVGRPIPGVELDLGERGEMVFRSPYSAVAFVEEEGSTLLSPEDWIPTGDHAERGEGGTWRLLGRANQVFKRYGEKIALGQLLDTVASGWSGQAQFYRERDRMDEEGFVLLLAPSPAEEDVRAILKAFRAKHPRTHWPLRVESAERLPVLPNGKVDLAALGALEGKTVHWRNRI